MQQKAEWSRDSRPSCLCPRSTEYSDITPSQRWPLFANTASSCHADWLMHTCIHACMRVKKTLHWHTEERGWPQGDTPHVRTTDRPHTSKWPTDRTSRHKSSITDTTWMRVANQNIYCTCTQNFQSIETFKSTVAWREHRHVDHRSRRQVYFKPIIFRHKSCDVYHFRKPYIRPWRTQNECAYTIKTCFEHPSRWLSHSACVRQPRNVARRFPQ